MWSYYVVTFLTTPKYLFQIMSSYAEISEEMGSEDLIIDSNSESEERLCQEIVTLCINNPFLFNEYIRIVLNNIKASRDIILFLNILTPDIPRLYLFVDGAIPA